MSTEFILDEMLRNSSTVKGEIEFETRDALGRTINKTNNLIKIFTKEVLSHRVPSQYIWDPNANSGAGSWISNGLNLDEFAPRYIVFGASFNNNGSPLDYADTRFYAPDQVSGGYIPVTLGVGAEYSGGLINPIPVTEPTIPLKRVERIYFEPSYQPAGTPLLQSDVRCLNNVVVFETTLKKEEYNGFGTVASNYFTITEVALVAAKQVNSVGACNCNPKLLFLGGNGSTAINAVASGSSTVSIASSVSQTLVDSISIGDQIMITAQGQSNTSIPANPLNQVSPYYLVVNKSSGGRDMTLDRVPVNNSNAPITGNVGVFRDGFRILAHRVLPTPYRKSSAFEIVVRWRMIFN